jgi:hypothetical protein
MKLKEYFLLNGHLIMARYENGNEKVVADLGLGGIKSVALLFDIIEKANKQLKLSEEI